MLFGKASIVAALSLLNAQVQAQHVVAHFIAGNAAPSFDWQANIQAAQNLGIEAFALNVARQSFDQGIVQRAYDAAAAANFKIFLQFDYAATKDWADGEAQGHFNDWSTHAAQYKVDDKALVSTFEGGASSSQFAFVDPATTLFVPDYTSNKGDGSLFQQPYIGGALSWDVWPVQGQTGVADQIDTDWKNILGDKTYVMGVSPWFYTKLLQFDGKNWVARGSELWHSRWEQVVRVQPKIVEILTWNDFGESHHIGPIDCIECMPGSTDTTPGQNSAEYTKGYPHDGFAALLPAYIDAYKTNNQSTIQLDEKLVFAHTVNSVKPREGCTNGGTIALHGSAPAEDVALDAIDVYVVLNSPAQVKVKVSDQDLTPQPLEASLRGVNHFSVPLNGAIGEVQYEVSRDGNVLITGAETPGISGDCSQYHDWINYNAVTGVFAPS